MIGKYQHGHGEPPVDCYVPPFPLGCGYFDYDDGALQAVKAMRAEYARLNQEMTALQKQTGRDDPETAKWFRSAAKEADRQARACGYVVRRAEGDDSDGYVRNWPLGMSQEIDSAFRVYAAAMA